MRSRQIGNMRSFLPTFLWLHSSPQEFGGSSSLNPPPPVYMSVYNYTVVFGQLRLSSWQPGHAWLIQPSMLDFRCCSASGGSVLVQEAPKPRLCPKRDMKSVLLSRTWGSRTRTRTKTARGSSVFRMQIHYTNTFHLLISVIWTQLHTQVGNR